jgi:protein-disulfide isomerase
MHPHARRAAEAAMAADAQGKFWPYAELLFRNQKALAEADLRRYAAEAGLDVPRFESALASDANAALVVRDLRDARRYSIQGTPIFFINGGRFRGMESGDEAFRQAIDRALEKAVAATPAN